MNQLELYRLDCELHCLYRDLMQKKRTPKNNLVRAHVLDLIQQVKVRKCSFLR